MRDKVAIFILLAAAGFLAYFNSINDSFIWDDEVLVKNNAAIRNLSALPDLFTQDMGGANRYGAYRPLAMATYAFDYAIGKTDARFYHFTNVFLHILAAIGIYLCVNLFFQDNILASCAGLLFVVHPVHTEAVSYISGRSDPLAALFMLLSFIFYIRYAESGKKLLYCFILIWYTLALFSKENSLIFPALLLLYHFAFRKRFKLNALLSVSAMVPLYIFLRCVILKVPVSHTDIAKQISYSFRQVPGFFAAVTDYLRLLFFPVNLHMDYGDKLFAITDPRVIAGVAVFLFLLIYAFRKRREDPLLFFSVYWFFIALLPTSGIYPVTAFYMAEHWLYLPSIGFFVIAGRGMADLYRRKKRIFVLFFGTILAAFSSLTVLQNNYWREPVNFYLTSIEYTPSSARLYNNLGTALAGSGRYKESVAAYKKAISIIPGYAEAYNNLGVAYMNLDKTEEAIAAYKKAIGIKPKYPTPYDNLGILLSQSGRTNEALRLFRQAIFLAPDYGDAYYNAALEYLFQKNYQQSIKYCDKAASLGCEVPERLLKILAPYRK